MNVENIVATADMSERMAIGTADILLMFDAHSDYTPSVRVSVLASALAVVTANVSDEDLPAVLEGIKRAVWLNRQAFDKMIGREHGH